ncbi:TspO/MBR-related protein family-containing protein [Strongyloides ratti]|uniref:TspO/MBR-related protein family-containing protein n=1 Tax=Strongyloides ratti TaxID=34506 RepID=A0A090LEL9_STRRB|nr:TspO/MBR-related protein family-containing protein [Strongyloides ratti]CEF65980.1 TspO/MBR-related protein family-containing protein [Strongyloides ratti]
MIHTWTECDTKKALLSALVPAGVSAFTAYSVFKDKSVEEFLKSTCECKCVPKDPVVYSALDVLTFTPMGYAAYMVFKHGGGFDYNDTKVAMALYGCTLASWLGFIPVSKKKDRKLLFGYGALHSALAIGTCYAFYQIDNVAGKLCVPVALLTSIYTLMSYGGYRKFCSN